MIRNSLWARIVLAQIAIGLVLAVGLPLTIDRTIRTIGDDLTQRFLASLADRVVGNDYRTIRPANAAGMGRGAVATYLIDGTGTHHLSGPPVTDIAQRPLPPMRGDKFTHGPRSDFYIRPVGAGRWLIVAEDRLHPGVLLDDVIIRFLRQFAIIVPISLLISTIASLLAVRSALRPVLQAAREAEAINSVQPSAIRLHEDAVPVEILPLVHAANVLLQRAAEAYEQERVFGATVVHELRTALATISLRAELLPPGESRNALAQAVERATKVIGQMLELHAGAAELTAGPGAPVGEVAMEIVEELRDVVLQGGRSLVFVTVDNAGEASSAPVALISVTLRNIIENANRHSVAGGGIEVLCDDAAGTITVSDAGPGMNVRQGTDGRRVYSRADGVASGGSGLGLAIVTRLMESAGGHISFAASQWGGTAVTLHYPSLQILRN